MDDLEIELEVMEGVYGNDYELLCRSPPCLRVLLKPRTADDISQQYPAVRPTFELSNAKGLSEKRQADLMNTLKSLTSTLCDEPMLLVICEAAVDWITSMNAPEDDCCFCLFPLVMDNVHGDRRPYMKLMSCFHCFHSDCFGRWWRWLKINEYEAFCQQTSSLQDELELSEGSSGSYSVEISSKQLDSFVALCPVCRTMIHAADVAHVQEYLTTDLNGAEEEGNETVLTSSILTEEHARQARFAAELDAQQARGGIIEPRRLEVIMPGMYLTTTPIQSVLVPPVESTSSKVEACSTSGTSNSSSIETPELDPLKQVHRAPIRHHAANNKMRVGRSSARDHHSHTHATTEQDQGHQDFELRGSRKGKLWIRCGTKKK
ncbi:hypothetical protein O6H91_Y313600 [Diphasiastrum complanatum]|nr:hypothetical protein O6H91_Y313600 [Diphasiastrum complanatum]